MGFEIHFYLEIKIGVRDYKLWSVGDGKEFQANRGGLGSQWTVTGDAYFEDQGHELIISC